MKARWKLLGLASAAGVAATGAVVARKTRIQSDYEPDEIRGKLRSRLAEAPHGGDGTAPAARRGHPPGGGGDGARRPRSRGRVMLRLVLAACAAALLVAPAAHADPVALLDAPGAQDIALAGSTVIEPPTGARGRLTVDAVGIHGGTPRRLLTASGPGKGWGASAFVSASPTRVAVQVFYDRPDVVRGDKLQWRL